MSTGRPVLVGHTECQRGQADKRNSMLAEEEGHGKGRRRQAGKRRLGARPDCPSDRRNERVGKHWASG